MIFAVQHRMLLALLIAQSVQLHGWVDVYGALNLNRPPDKVSFFPGTGTSAPRANEFNLNAAALDVALDPKPVGFHLTLAAGSGVDVLHGASDNPVYQASVSGAAGGLLVEAGIYPSHIGYESYFTRDNWNYTHGWMGEYSPYYQAGVKVAYAFDSHWSAQVHLLNGWQILGDNNRAKAIGTQVAWTSDSLTVAINGFAGPELPGDDSHWRLFGDLTAVFKATDKLSLGVTADLGWQDRAAGAALWHAASIYARYAFSALVAIALRSEYYDDRDGFMSGTPQLLLEGTATLELRPAEHLILKLESRLDASDADVFSTGSGKSGSQALFLAGAVASF